MPRVIILRDAVIFTPGGRVDGDVRIEDGRIGGVGDVSSAGAEEEIDLGGRWVWPGAIDGHVHFREPGPTQKEDWTTGSSAAVAGGVTTVFEMPNTKPTTTTVERLDDKRRVAEDKSVCNFGLFFGANPHNLHEARRVDNVAGLKIFMGCSTGDLLVYRPEDLEMIFEGYSGRICVHAESELRLREREKLFADRDDPAVHSEIRDPESAAEAVEMAAELAVRFERHLHVLHLSTRLELETLDAARKEAQERGRHARFTCEVCPHHLFFDVSAYDELGTFVRMNPPLRSSGDREEMWKALRDGRVDMVATDHAPHTIEEKNRPYRTAPSGVPGVQTMLPMMLDAAHRELCSHDDVLEWLCHRPATIYSLEERGTLEVGNVADLAVIDSELNRQVSHDDQFSRCGWTPWNGRTLTGWPVMTFVNGVLAFDRRDGGRGEVVAEPGVGREVNFGE